MNLKVESNSIRNGNAELKSNANYTLATCDSLSLSDTTISMIINIPGRRKQESTFSEQLYLPRNRKCIAIQYEKSDRSIRNVSYWPDVDYARNYHALMRGIRLDCILSQFGPFSENIVDIATSQVPVTKRNTAGQLIGQYVSKYGLLEIVIERINTHDRLKEVKMTQTAKDVYTSLSEGATLAQIRESVLDKTPDGLLTVTTGFRFSYDDTSEKPFSGLYLYDSYTATGQTYQSTYDLKITNYRKCFNEAEIEALRIPIPDGEKVYVVGDPSEGAINLTYRNGDIVRQVDGASLEQVATEERFHKNLIRVFAFSFGILSIAIVTWYARKRLFAKSSVKQ